jgi:hypothetical protein
VADSGYAEVAQWYADLFRMVPGIVGREVPGVDLSALKLEAQRALERGIPAPLPRSFYGAENADQTIRSAA